MDSKGVRSWSVSVPGYFSYALILLGWFFLLDVCEKFGSAVLGTYIDPFVYIVASWFVLPFLLAGVVGGINNQKLGGLPGGVGGFFKNACAYYLRFVGASIFLLVITIALVGVFSSNDQTDAPVGLINKIGIRLVFDSFMALKLFWFCVIVVDRGRVWRGLIRSVVIFKASRLALLLYLGWVAVRLANYCLLEFVEQYMSSQTAVMLDILINGLYVLLLVRAYDLAINIYTRAKVEVFGEAPQERQVAVSDPVASEDKLLKACFGYTFASFLPVFNVVALVLGILALKRTKRFSIRALVACCMGGFFTAVYLLMIVGLLLPRPGPVQELGCQFLVEADPSLESQVALLESGLSWQAMEQLQLREVDGSKHEWPFYCALAIAKNRSGDIDGAEADFYRVLKDQPDKGQFYYFYGLTLLDQGKIDSAAENFALAGQYQVDIGDAQRYLTLAQNTYEPPAFAVGVLFVVILLFLFTIHEYGHAYAAWKLGDDTAKNAGRLTLNPIAHLDLVGSLLLPGILLLRGSEMIFGWAKPVPVNTANFSNLRKDNMLVSFAGPAMNLAVAMGSFLLLMLLALLVRIISPEAISLNLAAPFGPISISGVGAMPYVTQLIAFLKQLLFTSLVLGCFNLIPIPPLDGSWILSSILPSTAAVWFEKLRPYSFFIILVVVFSPVLDYFLAVPIISAYLMLGLSFSAMGLG